MASPRTYTCRLCRATFLNRSLLHIHRVRAHPNQIGGGDLQPRPWADDHNPFEEYQNSARMEELYNDNDVYILAPHQFISPMKTIYNFPIDKRVVNNDVQHMLQTVYRHGQQAKAFKFTLSAGIIMENRENGELRYFKPATNMTILPDPILIKDRRTLQKAIDKLQELDIDELIRNYRINSKFIVKFVTNIEMNTYNTLFPLGTTDHVLPQYVRKNRQIRTSCPHASDEMLKDFCMFIALAQYRHPAVKNWKTRAVRYSYSWKEYMERINGEDKPCKTLVELVDIPDFEECFQLNVNIYELHPDNTASARYKSIAKFDNEMNLNINGNHVNLILDVTKFVRSYVCDYCQALFKTAFYLHRHQSGCNKKTTYVFSGGAYKYHSTLFDRLENVGIRVPNKDRLFPYFICYDFEAILAKLDVDNSKKLNFTHRHVPVSCSVASNVPGYTSAVCLIDASPVQLVNKLFDRLDEIRAHALPLIHAKWAAFMSSLVEKVETKSYEIMVKNAAQLDEAGSDRERLLASLCNQDPYCKQLTLLQRDFMRYINQIVILGFNSSRYDEQLIKRPLVKFLIERKETESLYHNTCCEVNVNDTNLDHCPLRRYYNLDRINEMYTRIDYCHREMGEVNVIKRGNSYVSVSNNFYHFLDICQYLPPATSYDKFLRAYGIENGKQYFCYEWLDAFEKLDEQLPPYPGEAWHSSLKDIDILADEYTQYVKGGRQGVAPLTGQQKYQAIQQQWVDNGWSSMKDLLMFYNNADVIPFVKATTIMMAEYFVQNIDVFKVAVSIPGISRYKMMQYAAKCNTVFPLFPEKDRDLFFLFKSQLCAGASLIITRLAQKGVTPIKAGSSKIVKSCIGLDANALYCAQQKLDMPSFAYVRRHHETQFKPEFDTRYYAMQVWLKHLSETTGWNLQTQSNTGKEVRVGPYALDGYALTDSNEQVAAEFYGCFFHQHINCELNYKCTNLDKYLATLKREAYLREKGFRVVTMWECDFKRQMMENQQLLAEYNKYKPTFFKAHPRPVTQEQILHAITEGKLYGYALVNVHVPLALRPMFDSFPPIFANHLVESHHLSPHMKEHVTQQGIKFNKGRRLLLTGMEAEEILLSTKMIAWYLKHGLRVTKVFQVIEFVASRPFKKFVDDIAERRLQGARDPNKKTIAEIYKLMG